METLTILILIGVVLAVLAAGRFKHPPNPLALKDVEGDEMWKWPLPDMEGSVMVMGQEEFEADNVVIPDLWFYRRKDKAFQEAFRWLEEGGKVWWRPFEVADANFVNGKIQGQEYVETRVVGGVKMRSKSALYLETVETTDEICRMAGFNYDKLDKGWRCYARGI